MSGKLVILGGGASGMMAAIAAAETMQKWDAAGEVLLLERNPKLGKKLLATGNGRCNLSNLEIAPSHYHGGTEWAAPILVAYPEKAIRRRFATMGLLCRQDDAGRVYPYNLQASAVLELLRLQLERLRVSVRTDCMVTAIRRERQGFQLLCQEGAPILAERVILAAGGKAAPKLGGIGSGTALAKSLGHTIVPEVPALVPLRTEPRRMTLLQGMRSLAAVTLLADGKALQTEVGEVQFTAKGLSGICVFQESGDCNRLLAKGKTVALSLNLMPEWKPDRLVRQIAGQTKRYPALPAESLLCGFLNQKVGQAVMRFVFGEQMPRTAGDCTYEDCQAIAEGIQDFRFPIFGSMDWDSAQVTAGGVSCKEIQAETLESRRCRGLYLCGELIDLDGDCGGYNLHWAWASGLRAGAACAAAWGKEHGV